MKRSLVTWLGIIGVTLIIGLGIFMVAGNSFNPPDKYPIKELTTGWTLYHDGKELKIDDPSKLYLSGVKLGDRFVLERMLTGSKIPNAAVYFRSLQSMVRAYVSDELVFRQGVEAVENGRMPGRTICYIPLPDRYVGKTLRIEITAGEPGAFTNLGPFTLGNQEDLFHEFISERQLPYLFGTFLTIFALLQFLLFPYLVIRNRKMLQQFFSALLVLAAGTYMLAFYNLFNLYISDPEMNTLLEFASIYAIPVAVSGYLQFELSGNYGRIYNRFTILNFLLWIVVVVLHFMNIVHISQSLMPMYVLCVVEIIPFFRYLLKRPRIKKEKLRENWLDEIAARLPALGMAIFTSASFLDMIYFLYMRDIKHDETGATIILTTAGGMVLAVCQMVSFELQGISFLRTEENRRRLTEKAYIDPLTGLYNRAMFSNEMDALDAESSEYAYICFDLDDVEYTDNKRENKKADKKVCAFASALRDTFNETDLVGRVGDNEFAVVIDGIGRSRLSGILHDFAEKVSRIKLGKDTGVEMSYGVAYSSECSEPNRPYNTYILSDSRMYEMKHAKGLKRGDDDE